MTGKAKKPLEFELTDELRGARFTRLDLEGARFRDVNFRNVKIADSDLTGASLWGAIDGLRINGVEVAPLIKTELDRQLPERARMRVDDPDSVRDTWDLIEELWSATVARARRLPEGALHERVDEEWSFVETLRHLVFVTDAWVSRTILGEQRPYHPIGLWTIEAPGELEARNRVLVGMGLDVDATPTLDDVLAARAERMAVVREILEKLTVKEFGRSCAVKPDSGPPGPPKVPVRGCLTIVIGEEYMHYRYAIRDLAVLESAR